MGKTIKGITFPEDWPLSDIGFTAVVVADMKKAIDFYESMGIGPFTNLTEMVTVVERNIRGKSAMDIENRCELTTAGSHMLELIQPIKGDDTFEKKALDSKGDHVIILGFYVDNLDQAIEDVTQKGFEIIETARFAEGGGFAFIDGTEGGIDIIEMVEWPENNLKKSMS